MYSTVLGYLIGALCLENKFYLTRQISALSFSPMNFGSGRASGTYRSSLSSRASHFDHPAPLNTDGLAKVEHFAQASQSILKPNLTRTREVPECIIIKVISSALAML